MHDQKFLKASYGRTVGYGRLKLPKSDGKYIKNEFFFGLKASRGERFDCGPLKDNFLAYFDDFALGREFSDLRVLSWAFRAAKSPWMYGYAIYAISRTK